MNLEKINTGGNDNDKVTEERYLRKNQGIRRIKKG